MFASTPATSALLDVGCALYIVDWLEIADGLTFELALGAVLEIG